MLPPCNVLSVHTGQLETLREVMGDGDQKEMLSKLVGKVATLEAAVGTAEAKRRELHNQLVELRGNVSKQRHLLPWFVHYTAELNAC